MEASEFQKTWYEHIQVARGYKLLHRFAEDERLDGRHFTLEGRQMLSFVSCSYLGLELDERLRDGVRDAVTRYGTQFSSSRTYISAPPYLELERRLGQIFGASVLQTPSTSLGHMSALPVLCTEKDAVLMDRMVHHSVQLAATLVRAQGAHVDLVRHGDMAALEEQLIALSPKHRKVWFLVDGVFSMYGDLVNVSELKRLLATYPKLHLYVDDAHGMSIAGKHGRGVHLSRMDWHPRMVLATSLNKAFAASGGALVFPDEELRERVRVCGGPYTFGGPVQPPMLGAALASSALHLSGEIEGFQKELHDRVTMFGSELDSRGVPRLAQSTVPIFFVKCGPSKMAYALCTRMLAEGFFISLATYPAVPTKASGLRLSLTRHHQPEDLKAVAQALAHHYPKALEECALSQDEIARIFASQDQLLDTQRRVQVTRIFGQATKVEATTPMATPALRRLEVQYATSAAAIEPKLWDTLVGHRCGFPHATLLSLEKLFRGWQEPEHNWGWHYFIVRDGERPVAATFFTDALWKDDMLARAEVSERVEALRARDRYHLTSRALAMGCLLTEGNHLYLDREGPWQQALHLLLEELGRMLPKLNATSLVFRDLPDGDAELDAAMFDAGLVKVPMLASHSLDLTTFKDEASFLARLQGRTRRRVRADVLDPEEFFTLRVYRHGETEAPTKEDFAHFYGLYERLKQRKRRLNTFELPPTVFEHLYQTPGWELVSLHLSPEKGGPRDGRAVAVGMSCLNGQTLVAVLAGLDGEEREVSVYRQLLWRMIQRGKVLGATRLELGMDAEREKMRLGADSRAQCAYVELTNHDSVEAIAQLMQEVSLGEH